MRNRRFTPCLESMEFRITPSGLVPVLNDPNDGVVGAPTGSGGLNNADDPGGLPIYDNPGTPTYNPNPPLLIYGNG